MSYSIQSFMVYRKNERSHKSRRNLVKILFASENFKFAASNQTLVSAVTMAWNLKRFNVILKVIGQTDGSCEKEKISEIENLKSEMSENRASSLL